jgi:hypothetical protein
MAALRERFRYDTVVLRRGNIDRRSGITAKGFDTDQVFLAADETSGSGDARGESCRFAAKPSFRRKPKRSLRITRTVDCGSLDP